MEFRVLTSLAKVFADECPKDPQLRHASMLQNETFSFQIAYCGDEPLINVDIHAEGSLAPYMTLQNVEYVPSTLPVTVNHDGYILRDTPGLYPDPITPFKSMNRIMKNVWKSVWVTVKPEGITGKQTATVVFSQPDKGELFRGTVTLDIIPASIPEQDLICTMWFHVDGIAQAHNVEPYSEEGFELIGKYMKAGSERGVNMVLTPVLTPPLDTAIGGERMTVQLVDIVKDGDKYEFDCTKLARFIELAKANGKKYLEISHLFTQWGAYHAPKVMATDKADGQYKRIFGWETDAAGDDYVNFLHQFVPAIIETIKACGMENNTYFHVSDEPSIDHLEQYQKVSAILKELVVGFPIIDALSNIDFYNTGAISCPIPATNHIEPFLEADIENRWTYYCVGQWEQVANRFFGMPNERNRVLGVQLYKHNIAGFLQWGFNFYNTVHSLWAINPWQVTDAGGGFPSGDSFVVYPYEDGCVSSIRFEVFNEAIQDLGAMKLAESLCGRDAVMAVLEDGIAPITFKEYPHDPTWLLEVREKINALIAEKVR